MRQAYRVRRTGPVCLGALRWPGHELGVPGAGAAPGGAPTRIMVYSETGRHRKSSAIEGRPARLPHRRGRRAEPVHCVRRTCVGSHRPGGDALFRPLAWWLSGAIQQVTRAGPSRPGRRPDPVRRLPVTAHRVSGPTPCRTLQGLPARLPHCPVRGASRGRLPAGALAATDDESFTYRMRQILPAYFRDYWSHEPNWQSALASLAGLVDPSGRWRWSRTVRSAETNSVRCSVPARIISGEYDFICGQRWRSDAARGQSSTSRRQLGEYWTVGDGPPGTAGCVHRRGWWTSLVQGIRTRGGAVSSDADSGQFPSKAASPGAGGRQSVGRGTRAAPPAVRRRGRAHEAALASGVDRSRQRRIRLATARAGGR